MTKDEYREARKKLGYSVQEWLDELLIKLSTHEKYNSGRNKISPRTARHIRGLLDANKGDKE